MKNMIRILYITVLTVASVSAGFSQEEITIFDQNKKPVAYLLADARQWYIYNFEGEGIAILEHYDEEDYVLYGKNGLQLGWFSEGWLYDVNGFVVGFLEGALRTKKHRIPPKKMRQAFKWEGFKEPARIKGLLSHTWSTLSLSSLFSKGTEQSPYPDNYLFENKSERKVHKI
jgi:hypothetical protein